MSAASFAGLGAMGSAAGPAQLANVHLAGGGGPTGFAGRPADSHGAQPAQTSQATQGIQGSSDVGSAMQVHHQVNHMLGEISPELQTNQLLQMLVAAMILQALNPASDNNDNAAGDVAATLVSASAGASLAALSQTAGQMQSANASAHAIDPPRAVHTTPYAQQAQSLSQPQQPPQSAVDLSV